MKPPSEVTRRRTAAELGVGVGVPEVGDGAGVPDPGAAPQAAATRARSGTAMPARKRVRALELGVIRVSWNRAGKPRDLAG
jgi:hypothetical protein